MVGEIVFYTVPVGGTDLPLIVAWLVVAGLVFTGWFGLIQVRKFKLAIDVVRGKYDEKGSAGEVNHFQALTAAVSGTVGLGNIAGVAVAVSIGGPGATFWMILCGLLGMATKFVEVTLGVKYREVHADGTVSGGPMHYLPKGLAERFGNDGAKLRQAARRPGLHHDPLLRPLRRQPVPDQPELRAARFDLRRRGRLHGLLRRRRSSSDCWSPRSSASCCSAASAPSPRSPASWSRPWPACTSWLA